jgi:D-glycero-alpha-D-manno-heptose-7-phosphate kinase
VPLVARAPTRIDFGGGWTDVPPYDAEQGGFVCNVAIARHATVELDARGDGSLPDDAEHALARAALRRARLDGHAARLTSDYPVGAGLGGSSAAGVALVAACRAARGLPVDDRAAMAEESRAIEVEDLGIAGGRQDHYAAAFGGALGLEFTDRVAVHPIALDDGAAAALERRLVLAYTGQSRISATTINGVLDAYATREPRVTASLARMAALAREMARALAAGSLDELGELVGEHWVHQRGLHPGITTDRIELALERARRAGALGGKALGASGGGCIVAIAPADDDGRVRAAMGGVAELLDARIDRAGVTVTR